MYQTRCITTANFGKTWVFRRYIWDTSATPSGIKREWYVCMYEIILCGCYACGPLPHAWANPLVVLILSFDGKHLLAGNIHQGILETLPHESIWGEMCDSVNRPGKPSPQWSGCLRPGQPFVLDLMVGGQRVQESNTVWILGKYSVWLWKLSNFCLGWVTEFFYVALWKAR
jgi:hypothetical protein